MCHHILGVLATNISVFSVIPCVITTLLNLVPSLVKRGCCIQLTASISVTTQGKTLVTSALLLQKNSSKLQMELREVTYKVQSYWCRTRIPSCSQDAIITEGACLDIGIVNKRTYSETILLSDKELYRRVISKPGRKCFIVGTKQ
jgi:hypothetical protein